MTLKSYNVIVCFIILLSLVVLNAQKTTLIPSSTISGPKTTTTLEPSTEENTINTEFCVKGNACQSANNTLALCNGSLKTPDKYIEEGIKTGVYKPEDRGLARCMCNLPYYNTLTACIECFVDATFKVSPLQEYEDQCKKVGTTFTQTAPPPPTDGMPPKLKIGLLALLGLVVLGLIGLAALKFYKKKKRATETHRVSVEGAGNLSTGGPKYPPPQSPSTYSYQQYAPPSGTPYYPPPPPPGDQYPPPPHPQHSQGGQSDSYYNNNFE
ncbi:hypothetical protein C1645_767550 [Glomus cerebriforme]|uniref:Uncharacterized protein n=1 Tax=Glomus cerebriforme TaxID=658196 RepID=A0A397T8L4_9GLOM|nr:hypothetical protein C1645_767550 [Glomus cerebriforme]